MEDWYLETREAIAKDYRLTGKQSEELLSVLDSLTLAECCEYATVRIVSGDGTARLLKPPNRNGQPRTLVKKTPAPATWFAAAPEPPFPPTWF